MGMAKKEPPPNPIRDRAKLVDTCFEEVNAALAARAIVPTFGDVGAPRRSTTSEQCDYSKRGHGAADKAHRVTLLFSVSMTEPYQLSIAVIEVGAADHTTFREALVPRALLIKAVAAHVEHMLNLLESKTVRDAKDRKAYKGHCRHAAKYLRTELRGFKIVNALPNQETGTPMFTISHRGSTLFDVAVVYDAQAVPPLHPQLVIRNLKSFGVYAEDDHFGRAVLKFALALLAVKP